MSFACLTMPKCVCVYNLQTRKTPKLILFFLFFYLFYYYLQDTFLGQVGGVLSISRLPIDFFVSSLPYQC